MEITINRVSGGLIATSPKTLVSAVEIDDLPASIRERARALLTPERLATYAARSSTVGGADREQYEVDFVDGDRVRRVCVDEAACPSEFLDLLDDLIARQ